MHGPTRRMPHFVLSCGTRCGLLHLHPPQSMTHPSTTSLFFGVSKHPMNYGCTTPSITWAISNEHKVPHNTFDPLCYAVHEMETWMNCARIQHSEFSSLFTMRCVTLFHREVGATSRQVQITPHRNTLLPLQHYNFPGIIYIYVSYCM